VRCGKKTGCCWRADRIFLAERPGAHYHGRFIVRPGVVQVRCNPMRTVGAPALMSRLEAILDTLDVDALLAPGR